MTLNAIAPTGRRLSVGSKRKATDPSSQPAKRRRVAYTIGIESIRVSDADEYDLMSYRKEHFETEAAAKQHVIATAVRAMEEQLQCMVARADANDNGADDEYNNEDDMVSSLIGDDGRVAPDFDLASATDVYHCLLAHFEAMDASTSWKTIDSFLDNAMVQFRRKLKCGYGLNRNGSPNNGLVRVLHRGFRALPRSSKQ